MSIQNRELKKRILEISYKHKLSHLGSCITAVDIIEDIFNKKKRHEIFILSSGHAGLALYCVLEKHGVVKDAQELFLKSGVHPDRLNTLQHIDGDLWSPIDCSTGSLGHGLGIAVGMALANRKDIVWCLISDGEIAEGSIHEAFRIAEEQKLNNLVVYVNWNGWGAYRDTESYYVPVCRYVNVFEIRTDCNYLPFLEGLAGHYHVMNEEQYKIAMEVLNADN